MPIVESVPLPAPSELPEPPMLPVGSISDFPFVSYEAIENDNIYFVEYKDYYVDKQYILYTYSGNGWQWKGTDENGHEYLRPIVLRSRSRVGEVFTPWLSAERLVEDDEGNGYIRSNRIKVLDPSRNASILSNGGDPNDGMFVFHSLPETAHGGARRRRRQRKTRRTHRQRRNTRRGRRFHR